MSLYLDLMIVDDALAVDADGLPLQVADRDSIAQDLRHMIRESGELIALVAERDPALVQLHEQRLTRLVDEDPRIVPGTAAIARVGNVWTLTATTAAFGAITMELSA
jgi:hypothetical protein